MEQMEEFTEVSCKYRDWVHWMQERGKSFPLSEDDFHYWISSYLVENKMFNDHSFGIIDGKLRMVRVYGKSSFQIGNSREETLAVEEFMDNTVNELKKESDYDFKSIF